MIAMMAQDGSRLCIVQALLTYVVSMQLTVGIKKLVFCKNKKVLLNYVHNVMTLAFISSSSSS